MEKRVKCTGKTQGRGGRSLETKSQISKERGKGGIGRVVKWGTRREKRNI